MGGSEPMSDRSGPDFQDSGLTGTGTVEPETLHIENYGSDDDARRRLGHLIRHISEVKRVISSRSEEGE
jgi:hypothetical protein